MTPNERRGIEEQIVRQVVSDVLAAGYLVSVNDADSVPVYRGTELEAVVGAMFATDEETLWVHRPGAAPAVTSPGAAGELLGWVQFVYGNDGWDVIADSGGRVEPLLVKAEALAECFAEQAVA